MWVRCCNNAKKKHNLSRRNKHFFMHSLFVVWTHTLFPFLMQMHIFWEYKLFTISETPRGRLDSTKACASMWKFVAYNVNEAVTNSFKSKNVNTSEGFMCNSISYQQAAVLNTGVLSTSFLLLRKCKRPIWYQSGRTLSYKNTVSFDGKINQQAF